MGIELRNHRFSLGLPTGWDNHPSYWGDAESAVFGEYGDVEVAPLCQVNSRGKSNLQSQQTWKVTYRKASTFFELLSSLELSDTQVYEPRVRALLGTASNPPPLSSQQPWKVNYRIAP